MEIKANVQDLTKVAPELVEIEKIKIEVATIEKTATKEVEEIKAQTEQKQIEANKLAEEAKLALEKEKVASELQATKDKHEIEKQKIESAKEVDLERIKLEERLAKIQEAKEKYNKEVELDSAFKMKKLELNQQVTDHVFGLLKTVAILAVGGYVAKEFIDSNEEIEKKRMEFMN